MPIPLCRGSSPGIELSTADGEIIGLYVGRTSRPVSRSPRPSRIREQGGLGLPASSLRPLAPRDRSLGARASRTAELVRHRRGGQRSLLGPVCRQGRGDWRGGWASRVGRAATLIARRRSAWPMSWSRRYPLGRHSGRSGCGGSVATRSQHRGNTLSTGDCRGLLAGDAARRVVRGSVTRDGAPFQTEEVAGDGGGSESAC